MLSIDVAAVVARVRAAYNSGRTRPVEWRVEQLDGLSMEFANWRFNVRMSNTEPVVRIIAEAKDEASAVELINRVREAT